MHIDKASFITAFKLGTWFWAVYALMSLLFAPDGHGQ